MHPVKFHIISKGNYILKNLPTKFKEVQSIKLQKYLLISYHRAKSMRETIKTSHKASITLLDLKKKKIYISHWENLARFCIQLLVAQTSSTAI